MENASISAKEFAIQTQGAAGSTDIFIAKQKKAITEMKQMSSAAKSTKGAFASLKATVGNIASMLIFTEVLSLGTKALDDFVNGVKKTEESATTVVQDIKGIRDTLNNNSQTIASLNDEYMRLSKGVGTLGQNVNLTSEEYKRYREIANQISEIMPNLTQSFDSQGNAILKTKENLVSLNEEYEKTRQREASTKYGEMSSDIKEVFNDYQNTKVDTNDIFDNLGETIKTAWDNMFSSNEDYLYDIIDNNEQGLLAGLKEISVMTENELRSIDDVGIKAVLDHFGFNDEDYNFNEFIDKINVEIDSLTTFMENKAAALGEAGLLYAESTKSYWAKITDDGLKELFSSIFTSLSESTIESWNGGIETKEDMESFVNKLINLFAKNKDKIQQVYSEYASLDLSSLSLEDQRKQINDIVKKLSEYTGLPRNQIKLSLGIDDNIELYDQLENVRKQALEKFGGSSTRKLTVGSDGKPTMVTSYDKKGSEIYGWEKENIFSQEDIDLWQQIIDQAGTFDEAVEKFASAKEKIIEVSKVSLSDLWDNINVDDKDDPLAETKKSITELAKAGKLTSDAFKDLTGSDSFLEKLGIKEDDAIQIDKLVGSLNELVDSTDQLSSMSKGISSLSSNLGTKKNNKGKEGVISADTFAGMDSGLKEQTAEWENYVNVLGDVNSTYEQCQQATNDLATAYVSSANFLSNLTEENKGYYISQLDAMGVENADEIVKQALIDKTKQLALENQILAMTEGEVTLKTLEDVAGLIEHSNASTIAKSALVELVAQQNIFNNSNLSVEDKISALQSLASAAYGAAAAEELASQMKVSKGGAQNSYETVSGEQALKNITEKYTKVATDIKPIKVSPTKSTSTSTSKNKGSGKSKSSTQSKEIDWIEIRLDRLSAKYDKFLKKAEDGTKSLKSRTNNYKDAIKTLTKEINTLDRAETRYQKQANKYKKGLSKGIINKIENGTIDINNYKGDKLIKNIEGYQKYYEKVQDSISKRSDLISERDEKKIAKIQLKIDDYKSKQEIEEYTQSSIEKLISQKGGIGDDSDYKKLNKSLGNQIDNLSSQNKQIEKQQALVKKGTEQWYEYQNAINSNNQSIKDLTQSIMDNGAKAIERLNNSLEDYLEGLDESDESLNAKIANATTALEKNAFIDEKIDNVSTRKLEYQSNINAQLNIKKGAISAINGTSSDVRKQTKYFSTIQSCISSNIPIPVDALEGVTDPTLLDACSKYNSALEAYSVNFAAAALYEETSKADLNNLTQDKFNNIKAEYETNVNKVNAEKELRDSEAKIYESRGIDKSESYYRQQKANNETMIRIYKQEIAELEEFRQTQYALGNISEEVYDEMGNDINTLIIQTNDLVAENYDLSDSLNNLNLEKLKKYADILDNLSDRLKNLKSLAELNKDVPATTEYIVQSIAANNSKIRLNKQQASEIEGKIVDKLTATDNSGYGTNLTNAEAMEFMDLYTKGDVYGVDQFFKKRGLNYRDYTDLHDELNNMSSLIDSNYQAEIENQQYVNELRQQQVDIIKNYISALQKEKDIKDKTLAIEKARYALEKAKNNLTKQVWNGEQWVYTADEEAIQSAQENLDNLNFDGLIDALNTLTTAIEDLPINMYNSDGTLNYGDVIKNYSDIDNMDDVVKRLTEQWLDAATNAVAMYKLSPDLMTYISTLYPSLGKADVSILPEQYNQLADLSNANNALQAYNEVIAKVLPDTIADIVSRQNLTGNQYNFENLVLPNVTDQSKAIDLINDLNTQLSNLNTYAKQYNWNK